MMRDDRKQNVLEVATERSATGAACFGVAQYMSFLFPPKGDVASIDNVQGL